MSVKAKLYIATVTVAGLAILALELARWETSELSRYLGYLALTVLASGLKVRLPGVTGTLSVNFLFIFYGIAEFYLAETLSIGCAATLVQCFWQARKRPQFIQVAFNVASMAVTILASHSLYHSPPAGHTMLSTPLLLVLAASAFFFVNTTLVAGVIAFTENKSVWGVWRETYLWSFPYYLVGAALAGAVRIAEKALGWQTVLLVLPVIYVTYRSLHLHLGRLEDEKRHAENTASLYFRTIEALALAIEAKDHTTHEHLQRVQVYALEIGKELGLGARELEALHAASILHDIGKLAVPEHIISKPGKLTPEEFEKMKIHPVVGAEILERVGFPYDVVPIVRSHHERWNGSGYPDGLSGEKIPIGARILGAVDVLDALASRRQYRPALPLEKAMRKVAEESGVSFDPRVVEVLQRRCEELERMAQARSQEKPKLSTELKVERGSAPAAGFETSGPPEPVGASFSYLKSIASARQEVQSLLDLSQALGTSLSLDDTLAMLDIRLKHMVPHDTIAVYLCREGRLLPRYVNGESFRALSALAIPLGQGLCGWVAENRKPILNGNPSVEPGYIEAPWNPASLRSALAVPLEGEKGVVGVLALYSVDQDAFTPDQLRALEAASRKISLSIENAIKYQEAESFAATDYITGLPNARALFARLDAELARAKRSSLPLTVVVCDLDHFRRVNERFGRQEGDRVLRSVAEVLRETCREYDSVARMGSDEFVLLLPGLKPPEVAAKVDQLTRAVAEAGKKICGGEEYVSLSTGSASFPEAGADAEQLLAEADQRLRAGGLQRSNGGRQALELSRLNWRITTVQ